MILDNSIHDFEKGQYDFAVSGLNRFLILYPSSQQKDRASYYLGLSYYYKNDYIQAINAFKKLTTNYNNSAYINLSSFWIGAINHQIENYTEAEIYLSAYLGSSRDQEYLEKAYLLLIDSQLRQNKIKAGKDTSEKLMKINPKLMESAEFILLYSYILIQSNEIEKAVRYLLEIDQLYQSGKNIPLIDKVWLKLAEMYYQQKEFDNTRKYLKMIDNDYPKSNIHDYTLYLLSIIEGTEKNQFESAEYVKRLSELYPESSYTVEALINQFGYSIKTQSDAKRMLQLLDQINGKIQKAGTKSTGQLTVLADKINLILGIYFFEKNQFIDAKKYFSQMYLKKTTNGNYARLMLVRIFLDEKEISKARDQLSEIDPDLLQESANKKYYYLLKVRIYILAKNEIDALKIINRYLPDPDFINEMIRLLVSNNNYKELIKTLQANWINFPPDLKGKYYPVLVKSIYKESSIELINELMNIRNTLKNNHNINKEEWIDSELLLGILLYNTNQLDLSLNIFSQLLPMASKERLMKTNYYLGWIYYKMKDYLTAKKYFQNASSENFSVELMNDSLFMKGWCSYSGKNYSAAVKEFLEIQNRITNPKIRIKAIYYQAKSEANMKNEKIALNLYTAIINQSDSDTYIKDSLYEIIQIFFRMDDLVHANQKINEFRIKYPDDKMYIDLLRQLAEIYQSKERYSESFSIYQLLINRYLNNDMAVQYWAGFNAMKIGQNEIAGEYLYGIINSDNKSIYYQDSLVHLIQIARQENNFLEEKRLINLLLKSKINEIEKSNLDRRLKEIQLLQNGDDQKASELKVKIQSGDRKAKLDLAIYYSKGIDLLQSRRILEELFKENKDELSAAAVLVYTQLLINEGKYDEAVQYFREMISSYSLNTDILIETLYWYSYCLYKTGNKTGMLKLIEQMEKEFPGSVWTEKAILFKQMVKDLK